MGWVVTLALLALRDAFRQRFPNSRRDQDGTIGDTAHQASPSGHNPDDTPGSLAEYTDPDSKPEVRALDKDARLNDPAVTMWDVVQAILATPADRDRLAYIIFAGYIWRKRTGWQQEAYKGADKHWEHAHFSGDPAFDEAGAPWTSVLNIGRTSMDETTNITDPGWGPDGAELPAGWRPAAGGGLIAPLGKLLGGLHRRVYLLLTGLIYVSGRVDESLQLQRQILARLEALEVGAVPQEAIDAAVLHAVEAVRFETRAVPDA